MSLTMTELMATDSEVILRDNNDKRKCDDTDLITSKCEIESPSTLAAFVEDDPNSEHLSDIADSETSDASEQNSVKSSTSNRTSQSYEITSNDRESAETIHNPQYGQLVNRREFRRAGPYIIGMKLGNSPVDSIVQYLAKKENNSEFVQLKILMLNNNTAATEKQLQDERQGKMLLHTEFSLLSLLKNEPGVIQHHGMFSDTALEEVAADTFSNNNFYTGNTKKRLVLVLDCVTPHDFDPTSSAYVNLQQYLINRRKLTEIEALKIFYEIITVVERLHDRNIIHRDLKLGNIVLNKYSNKIKIINFCLGKYLLNENDLLYDQRGSPAYISADVLCGKPYKGKPSDMWALGVVLFMMLYRQFPFFESTPAALFKKIKSAEYTIPINNEISKDAEQIIRGLLQLNPEKRLTATQVRKNVKSIIDSYAVVQDVDRLVPELGVSDDLLSSRTVLHAMKSSQANSNDQVVPTMTLSNTSEPPSRKRRRSTDKIFDEMLQRGISIEQIDTNSEEWKNSNLYKFRKILEENRKRFEMPTPGQASVARPMPSPNSTPSSQPVQIPYQRIISLPDLRSPRDRSTGPPISTLIRYPSTIRIVPRGGVRNNINPNPSEGQTNNLSIRPVPLSATSIPLANAFMTRDQNRPNFQSNMPSILRSLPNNNFQFTRQMNRPAINNNNNSNNNNPLSDNIRNSIVRNMRQMLESSTNSNNQSPSERFRQAMVRLQLPNPSRQESQMRQLIRRVRRGRSSTINNNNINRHPSAH